MLGFGLVLSFRLPRVQSFVVQSVATYLSKQLHAQVKVGSVDIRLFRRLALRDILVRDLQKDTLFYVQDVEAKIRFFSWTERKVDISKLKLSNIAFHLRSPEGETSNLDFIIRYFSSSDTSKRSNSSFLVNLHEIDLKNLHFTYKLKNAPKIQGRINFDDVDVLNFNMRVIEPRIEKGKFVGRVRDLNFREKSGMYCKNISTKFSIHDKAMEFDDLILELAQSRVRGFYGMYYKSFSDFSDYNNKVFMKGRLKGTKVHMKDIAYFAPPVMPIFDIQIELDGRVFGVVNHLKTSSNMLVKLGEATYMRGAFTIKNTDTYRSLALDLRLKQMGTNFKDLRYILPVFLPIEAKDIPYSLDKFGYLNLRGNISGLLQELSYKGEVKTDLGVVQVDYVLQSAEWQKEKMSYIAKVSSPKFQLASFVPKAEALDYATFSGELHGIGFSTKFSLPDIQLDIQEVQYRKVLLHDIKLDAKYSNHLLFSAVNFRDKILNLQATGFCDFSDVNNPRYKFDVEAQQLNLCALKLSKNSVNISGKLNLDISGTHLDDISGMVDAREVNLSDPKESHTIPYIKMRLKREIEGKQSFSIKSTILDANINGKIVSSELPKVFEKVYRRYFTSDYSQTEKLASQNFDFFVQIKNTQPLTTFFIPKVQIQEGGSFKGVFNSVKDSLVLNGGIKRFTYNDYTFENFIIDEATTIEGIEIIGSLDKLILPSGVEIKNWTVANIVHGDTMIVNLKIADKKQRNETDLNGRIVFKEDKEGFPMHIDILPSTLMVEGLSWQINNLAKIKIKDKHLIIHNLSIKNQDQVISIKANAGELGDDDYLSCVLQNVDIASFAGFIQQSLKIKLEGKINGNIDIQHPLGHPNIESNLSVKRVVLDSYALGDLDANINYDTDTKLMDVMTLCKIEQDNKLVLKGIANMKTEDLNFNLSLANIKIDILQTYFGEYIGDVSGTVSGNVKIQGTLAAPNLNGMLQAKDAGLKIKYLQETYITNDKVAIQGTKLVFNNCKILDKFKHIAYANGEVDFKKITNPKYRFQVDMNNFHILNTTIKNNDLFYGQVLATGKFSLGGDYMNTKIGLELKTDAGTLFNMPTFSSGKVNAEDYISFVSRDTLRRENIKIGKNLYSLDLSLLITEAATANIQTNLGNLTSNGSGNLVLKMSSSGNITLFGDYVISKGKYEFSIKNQPLLRNLGKKFELQNGSTLTWSGKPMDAFINIKTMYPVITQVAPLYAAAGRSLSESDPKSIQQYQVNVMLSLKGLLKNPDISFDIDFPTDPSIKEDLNAYLTDNNKFNQAISLVVKKSFTKGASDMLDSKAATQLGVDYAFSRLNNIIADAWGLKFLNFNSRSVSDYQASLNFFDGRLLLVGGIINNTMVGASKSTQNTLTPAATFYNTSTPYNYEINASYAIKKDRSFTFNVYNKPSTFSLYNLSGDRYMSGLGVTYYSEFDSFLDWVKRLWRRQKDNSSLGRIIPTEQKSRSF